MDTRGAAELDQYRDPATIAAEVEANREEAKERLLNHLKRQTPEEIRGRARQIQGMVAQHDAQLGTRVLPSHQTLTEGALREGRVRELSTPIPEGTFTAPDIVKRSAQQRVESLTARLIKVYESDPVLAESLFNQLQGELTVLFDYKTGVTAESIRALAAMWLERAKRRSSVDKQRVKKGVADTNSDQYDQSEKERARRAKRLAIL